MKSFIYAKTTTTYAILMPLPLIIRVTNTYWILLFTERTNSGKHYHPKLKTMHHCSSLKIKSKLGTVIYVNVRLAQDILPILVTFSLIFQWPKVDKKQNCIIATFKWPKCPFFSWSNVCVALGMVEFYSLCKNCFVFL